MLALMIFLVNVYHINGASDFGTPHQPEMIHLSYGGRSTQMPWYGRVIMFSL